MDNGVFKFLSLIFEEILTVEFDEDLNELINIKSDSFELKWENNSLTKQTDNKYRIILCELTSGSKNLDDAREKFKNSGEVILTLMRELGREVFKIDCLVLGKIVKNGRVVSKRYLAKPIQFRGYGNKNSIINQQNCGFSIKKLYA